MPVIQPKIVLTLPQPLLRKQKELLLNYLKNKKHWRRLPVTILF